MAAVLLALGSSLSFGIADFFGGVVTRRLAVVVVLLVSQTVGLAGIALLVLVRGEGPPDAVFVPLALAASVLGVVGLAALYRGLATGMMSVVAPIAATASCVAVVAGFVTGETPTRLQNAGIALALGGVILVSLVRSEGETRMRLAAGAGLGLVAAGTFGAFLIAFDRAATDDPYWATLVLRIGSVTLLAIVALSVGPRPSRALGAATFLLLGSIGLLDMAGNALFAVASTKGVVGVVAVLTSLYPVVTVALARVVLKERLQARQVVGVVCALAGVGLIAAG